MTTAGPTLAAAFAIVSLPRHPQQGLGDSLVSLKGGSLFTPGTEVGLTLKRDKGGCPMRTPMELIKRMMTRFNEKSKET